MIGNGSVVAQNQPGDGVHVMQELVNVSCHGIDTFGPNHIEIGLNASYVLDAVTPITGDVQIQFDLKPLNPMVKNDGECVPQFVTHPVSIIPANSSNMNYQSILMPLRMDW